jgi:hypothetical protein
MAGQGGKKQKLGQSGRPKKSGAYGGNKTPYPTRPCAKKGILPIFDNSQGWGIFAQPPQSPDNL